MDVLDSSTSVLANTLAAAGQFSSEKAELDDVRVAVPVRRKHRDKSAIEIDD